MTETDWLSCNDPEQMLRWMVEGLSDEECAEDMGWTSLPADVLERKLRLFVCAACRQVWDKLLDQRSRTAVEMAELHADGKTTRGKMQTASRAAEKALEAISGFPWPEHAAAWAGDSDMYELSEHFIPEFSWGSPPPPPALLAGLLRDVVAIPSWTVSLAPPLTTPRFCRLPGLLTTSASSPQASSTFPAWPSSPTPSKKPAAPIPTSSITCVVPVLMFTASGPWI